MNAPLILDEHGNLIDSTDVKAIAKTYTALAIDALVRNCSCGNPAAEVAASNALLAYGHGRPTATIEAEVKHTVDVGSFDRIAAKLQRALAAAGESEVPTVQ